MTDFFSIGASIIGAGTSIAASFLGADEESGASQQAFNLLQQAQQQARKDLKPFKQGGTEAFNRLVGTTKGDFAGFTETPGFRFRLGEGIKAIDQSAASRGLLLSGRQLKGVQRFGEGLAANEFQNFQNRLTQLAGFGLDAATKSANITSQLAGAQANTLLQGGRARSAGLAGAASGANAGLENILFSLLR